MQLKYFVVLLFSIISCISADPITPKKTSEVWDAISAKNKTNLIDLLHSGNKSYYLGFYFKATYFQAYQFCDSIHMKLVSIQSPNDNERIYKYVRDANKVDTIWTSGAKILDGKQWVWMANGQPVQYTNWGPGNPSTITELCIEVYQTKNVNLFWNDRDCMVLNNFICERDMSEIPNGEPATDDWFSKYDSPYMSPILPLFHYEDKSYYVGTNVKATFQEALQICEMMKMQLITITSEKQNNITYKYLRDTVAGTDFWTSATKMLDGKTWIWMTTAQVVDYTNWNIGRPSTLTYQCICLQLVKDKELYWNDADCSVRNFFICEKPRSYNNLLEVRRATDTAEYKRPEINNIKHPGSNSIEVIHMSGRAFHLGINFKATYSQAVRYCERHYMQLVSIPSWEDNDIVRSLLLYNTAGRYGFWTSAQKLKHGPWTWFAQGDPITYFNWKSNESQNATQNKFCIQINNDEAATWIEEYCEKERYFICTARQCPQMPLAKTTPTSISPMPTLL